MKKALLALIIIGLMLATVFHIGFSASAINIQKQSTKEEEKTGYYELRVNVFKEKLWPSPLGGIMLAKVVVTYMFNPFFQRIEFTNIMGSVTFSIPDEYEGVTVKASHPLYEVIRSVWHNDYEVDILMEYTGVNLNHKQQISQHSSIPLFFQILQKYPILYLFSKLLVNRYIC
jgi:hypothetical protein